MIKRVGRIGKKLHTARSRNDQIALDERLYLRDEIRGILHLIVDFQKTHLQLAKSYSEVILPGYTHLQYAQPILLAHYLLAYFWMLERDKERLKSCLERAKDNSFSRVFLEGETRLIFEGKISEEVENV